MSSLSLVRALVSRERGSFPRLQALSEARDEHHSS